MGRLDLDSTEENTMSSGLFIDPKTGKSQCTTYVERDQSDPSGCSWKVIFDIGPGLANQENFVDDRTSKGNLMKPKKGIRVSTWCSVERGKISVFAGKEARYHEKRLWLRKNSKLGILYDSKHVLEGRRKLSTWINFHIGEKLFLQANAEISTLTGQTLRENSSLANTFKTPARIEREHNISICYGYSDAGMRRSNQIYLYVTPIWENWLGELIKEDARWLNVPFSILALVGSHDCGMLTPANEDFEAFVRKGRLSSMAQSDKTASAMKKPHKTKTDTVLPVIHTLIKIIDVLKIDPRRAIHNIANTQKDSIKTQLELGVRFFDMRPGWCFHDVIDGQKIEIYHQHSVVPGVSYLMFLIDVLHFLVDHPQEIVIVELKKDNLIEESTGLTPISMVPSDKELKNVLQKALELVPGSKEIQIGEPLDMKRTIGDLLAEKKRFFLFNRIHQNEDQKKIWWREDSYDHNKYNTFIPEPIIECLKKTHASYSRETDYDKSFPSHPPRGTIYQLQATPTAKIWADIAASFTWSDASSLLVYTKAVMDRETYRWIADNKFREPGNPIFLNDFVDGALVEHALEVSKERAESFWCSKDRAELMSTPETQNDLRLTPSHSELCLTPDSVNHSSLTPENIYSYLPRGPNDISVGNEIAIDEYFSEGALHRVPSQSREVGREPVVGENASFGAPIIDKTSQHDDSLELDRLIQEVIEYNWGQRDEEEEEVLNTREL